jgi:hypothetical protein
MPNIPAAQRVKEKRDQLRKVEHQLSYGDESLAAYLNHPTNYNLVSHQEIANVMIDKRRHDALASNLPKLRNLDDETRNHLLKKGFHKAVSENGESFASQEDESTMMS